MTPMHELDFQVLARALDRADPGPYEIDHLAALADARDKITTPAPRLRPRPRAAREAIARALLARNGQIA
jgi:hypothetical protein